MESKQKNKSSSKTHKQEPMLSSSRAHASPDLYESLINTINGIIWEADANTFQFSFVSPRAESLLGYPLTLWTSEPTFWKDHIHPDDRDGAVEYCVNSTREMIPHEIEYRMIAADGRIVWFKDIVTVISENKKPVRLHGVMVDITRQKQIEEALVDSEGKLRTIFDTMTEGVALNEIIYDINGEMIDYRILDVNQAFYSTADYKGPHVIGGLATQVYGMSQENIRQFWLEHKKENKVVHTEMESPISHRTFYISTSPFHNDKFVTSFLDITERKQAEQILHEQKDYLELLSDMTGSILVSENSNAMFHKLAGDLKRLTNADDCYITRWEAEREIVYPMAATRSDRSFTREVYNPAEPNMTASVMKAGHALAAEDVTTSPYVNKNIVKNYPARSVLGVPLIFGEHKLGAVLIAYNASHTFSPEEIRQAEQACAQIALALWTTQQEFEIQKNLREVRALSEISRALSERERVGLDEVLQNIVKFIKELIPDTEQAVIHLLDKERLLLIPRAVIGFDEPSQGKLNMRVGEGIAGHVVLDGESVNIADVENDERFLREKFLPRFRSLMVCPIQIGDNRLGTISVQSSQTNAFSADEQRLLKLLSTEAVIAIENARLLETTQQSFKEVNALYHITRSLVASLEPGDLMKEVVEHLQQSFGYYQVQIFIMDHQNGDLIMQYGSGEVGKQIKGVRLPAGSGIAGHAADTGKPFFANDVGKVIFFIRHPLMNDTHSELAVPIKINDRVLGVLDIQHRLPSQLTERDLQLVSAVADELAIALEKASLYSDLETSLAQEKATRIQLIQSERLAVIGRLLASVSHELNNPLQAIQNALFLLKDEEGISFQGKQDLQIVLSETERMAALIERLRASYRPLQTGNHETIQVNTLVNDTYSLLAAHLRHNAVRFEFQPDPTLPQVLGVPGQLRQVILNLFMNAVEAMPTGGTMTVTTELTKENEVLLIVADNGPGIAPEILPHLFDAFVTNKPSGTGLGLAISYEIVKNHNGRISAENLPDAGGIFRVWLPAVTEEKV